jgi:preprotein translocase subunit SecF
MVQDFTNSMFVSRFTKQFLIIAGLIFAVTIGILVTLGLPLGIDFTGGALTEVSYEIRPEKSDLESTLNTLPGTDLGGYSLRVTEDETGRPGYILRTRDLEESERQIVAAALTEAGEGGEIARFTSIGPVIGQELRDKAVWAIAAVMAVIVLYVAFAFRGVSQPVGSWAYGGITILVLINDVLVPAALMSILGYFLGAEIDILFVMAMLAVLGYSVNDTIVVFDRVRENLVKYRQEKKVKKNKEEEVKHIFTKPFDEIVGESVSQTLARSINTSLTTLLAVGALYFLGGDVTQNFALVLIAGILAGTYSSICIANPILIYFGNRKLAEREVA